MLKLLALIFIITLIEAGQNERNIVRDERTGSEMLIGNCSRQALSSKPFDSWFLKNYSEYLVDTQTLKPVLNNIHLIDFTIILGTWCGDSHREVPRFYKILDSLRVDENRIRLIAVNRQKTSLNDETNGLNILRIPTFILSREGVELGRIVESPETTLEKDIATILSAPGNN